MPSARTGPLRQPVNYAFATLLLSVSLTAQTVRVENQATLPFVGWKRTTIDRLPPHLVGQLGNTLYVVGRAVGLDVHVVDLRVSLAPGQQLTLDLSQAGPAGWTRGPFPVQPQAWFGGDATIDGVELQPVSLLPDGAGYTLQLRARPQPMVNVDLWCTWYPDQPAFCHGEVAITASNPSIPDMGAILPAGFPLHFGNAVVLPLGGQPWNLLPNGLTLTDGQCRILPVTFLWLQHLQGETVVPSVIAAAGGSIGAVGIQQLLVDGNPVYPPGFSARAWMLANWSEAVRRLHTFDEPVCGPARKSSVAGRQEDQTFVRGEPLLADGVGSEWIAYLSALKLAARPCHHLEQDGRPLDLAMHVNPRLVFWEGRPHWHTGLSPDRLGKYGSLTLDDTKGWWGPDAEHWLMNTLAAATRLTGSPACQWLLGHQARIFLLTATVTPGLSTSQPFAARAVGWEGIMAVHLWRELEDRAMADEVRTRWQQRVDHVILPAYGNRSRDVWDPRLDDPRLGKGWWYHPWQQAVGAYGLDLACAVLGPPRGRDLALEAAKAVLHDAFEFDGSVWRNRAAVALDGRYSTNGIFYLFGSPLAPAVVLRHEPGHPIARAIWDQMHADATGVEHFSWFAPGVQ